MEELDKIQVGPDFTRQTAELITIFGEAFDKKPPAVVSSQIVESIDKDFVVTFTVQRLGRTAFSTRTVYGFHPLFDRVTEEGILLHVVLKFQEPLKIYVVELAYKDEVFFTLKVDDPAKTKVGEDTRYEYFVPRPFVINASPEMKALWKEITT
jgi:hypothetical protein